MRDHPILLQLVQVSMEDSVIEVDLQLGDDIELDLECMYHQNDAI